MKDEVRLIRKLHLKKGHKYILFLPYESMPTQLAGELGMLLRKEGFNCIIGLTNHNERIKVIEQKEER